MPAGLYNGATGLWSGFTGLWANNPGLWGDVVVVVSFTSWDADTFWDGGISWS